MTLADINPPPELWRHDLIIDEKKGTIVPNAANVVTIITRAPEWKGVLAWDSFGGKVVATRPPPWHPLDCAHPRAGAWTDDDDGRLQNWMIRRLAVDYRKPLTGLVNIAARQQEIHPIRDYLERIEWDGNQRTLATYFGAEGPLAEMAARWMLVSAVARIYEPGCKVDTMTIFEGEQGMRKSSGLRALFGAEWFSDTPIDLGSKDAYQALRGKWCHEWAEFESSSRYEQGRIKAYCSSASDHYRESYGRRTIDVPRQCVFVASTNHREYLKDETGGRRFMPFWCSLVDLDAISRDRDQLWAEAVQAYRAGEAWWATTPEQRALCADAQDARFSSDAWEDVIAKWLKGITRSKVTTDEVASQALGIEVSRLSKAEQMRIAAAMRRQGCKQLREQQGQARVRVWALPDLVHKTDLTGEVGQPNSFVFPE